MGTQHHLRTHSKFNGLVPPVVKLCLLLLGGNQRGFGLRNQLRHVVNKRLCRLNSVHAIQLVYHSPNILAVTQLKRRLARGHSNRRIDGKFNKWYFIYPLLIVVNGHTPQDLFNSAICPFRLTICLWMERTGQHHTAAQHLKQSRPETAREPWVSIMDHGLWYAKAADNVVEKQFCCSRSG